MSKKTNDRYGYDDTWTHKDFYSDDRYGDLYPKYNNNCLSEMDFYPPSDNRVLNSYIEDIDGGDNFEEYCEYIFELYEEEGYYN